MIVELKVAGEDQGLGIPYPKGTATGSTNVGYVDLKKNPEALAGLPELQDWPELEGFLRAVNLPDSLFRTLRCEVAASPIKHSGCTRKVTSYVTVAFELLDWNQAQGAYGELYRSFREYSSGLKAPVKLVVEFELIPTSYLMHGINRGWSVDVWISGLGTSKDAARATWRAGLRIVQDFLTKESALYADQLKQGRATLG
jgi:hypothetical protein